MVDICIFLNFQFRTVKCVTTIYIEYVLITILLNKKYQVSRRPKFLVTLILPNSSNMHFHKLNTPHEHYHLASNGII